MLKPGRNDREEMLVDNIGRNMRDKVRQQLQQTPPNLHILHRKLLHDARQHSRAKLFGGEPAADLHDGREYCWSGAIELHSLDQLRENAMLLHCRRKRANGLAEMCVKRFTLRLALQRKLIQEQELLNIAVGEEAARLATVAEKLRHGHSPRSVVVADSLVRGKERGRDTPTCINIANEAPEAGSVCATVSLGSLANVLKAE
jgi:hypothetical protein